ncbi:YkvA family protein [Bacteroidia bacterium]|jgi:uncharacterized membrane protein YkvA (DUF1232 family)|nr:YkvA family protein [Bacteroidia bacterium]
MKKLRQTIALIRRALGSKKTKTSATTWKEDLSDVQKMISSVLKGTFKIKKRNTLIILGGLVYVLSPMDFLPEALLGPLGLADDAAILVFVYKRITGELERFRNESKLEDVEVIS